MGKFITAKEAALFYGVAINTIYTCAARFMIPTKIKTRKDKKTGPKDILYIDTAGLNKHLNMARIHGKLYK